MESLYLSARVTVLPDGTVVDPKERMTVHLFSYLFNKCIFDGDYYNLVSQESPSAQSNLACDLVVRYATDEGAWQVLCFAEAKRASNQADFKIRILEDQALMYCEEFIRANENCDMVYAMTLVGTSVRCWRYNRDEGGLQGFWDNEVRGFGPYLDIGLERNRVTLENSFQHMKTTPTSHMPVGLDHAGIGSTIRRH